MPNIASAKLATTTDLNALKLIEKRSRANYSDGAIRCEYDQHLYRTYQLLDTLPMFALLRPSDAEHCVNKIIKQFRSRLNTIEQNEKNYNFSNLTEQQFSHILQNRKQLYNSLQIAIKSNLVVMPITNTIEPIKLLKPYNFLNIAQQHSQFLHRIEHDLALFIPNHLRLDLSRLHIDIKNLEENFKAKAAASYQSIQPEQAQLEQVLTNLKSKLAEALNKDISYKTEEGDKICHTYGKSSLVSTEFNLDTRRVSITENPTQNRREDLVHVTVVRLPSRQQYGRPILSDTILSEYLLLMDQINLDKDNHPIKINFRDPRQIPSWFSKLKLGEKILLCQTLLLAKDHAITTFKAMHTDMPQLDNLSDAIKNSLILVMIKEFIDAYYRTPSNIGRNTPGLSSISYVDNYYYIHNKFVRQISPIKLEYANVLSNHSSPTRAGGSLIDDDLVFTINNLLQDLSKRLLSYYKWINTVFGPKSIPNNELSYYFISVCLLSPSSFETMFPESSANNNKTMTEMVSYAHQWLNWQVQQGKLLNLLKAQDDFDSLEDDQQQFLQEITVIVDVSICGVNFIGRYKKYFAAGVLSESTGILSVVEQLCYELHLFIKYYDKLSNIELDKNPDISTNIKKQFTTLADEFYKKLSHISRHHRYNNITNKELSELNAIAVELNQLVKDSKIEAIRDLVLRVTAISSLLIFINLTQVTNLNWFSHYFTKLCRGISGEINFQLIIAGLILLCLPPDLRKAYCKSCHDRAQMVRAAANTLMIFYLIYQRLPNFYNRADMEEFAMILARQIYIGQVAATVRSTGGSKGPGAALKNTSTEQGLPGVLPKSIYRYSLNKLNQGLPIPIDSEVCKRCAASDDIKLLKMKGVNGKEAYIQLENYIHMNFFVAVLKTKADQLEQLKAMDDVAIKALVKQYLDQMLDSNGLEQWAKDLPLNQVLDLTWDVFSKHLHSSPGLDQQLYNIIYNCLYFDFHHPKKFTRELLLGALDDLRLESNIGFEVSILDDQRHTIVKVTEFTNNDDTIESPLLPNDQGQNKNSIEIQFDDYAIFDRLSNICLVDAYIDPNQNLSTSFTIEYPERTEPDQFNVVVLNYPTKQLVKELIDQQAILLGHSVNKTCCNRWCVWISNILINAMEGSIKLFCSGEIVAKEFQSIVSKKSIAQIQTIALLEGKLGGGKWFLTWLIYCVVGALVVGALSYLSHALIKQNFVLGSLHDDKSNTSAIINGAITGYCLTSLLFVSPLQSDIVRRMRYIRAQQYFDQVEHGDTEMINVINTMLERLKKQERYEAIIPLGHTTLNKWQNNGCVTWLNSLRVITRIDIGLAIIQAGFVGFGFQVLPSMVATICDTPLQDPAVVNASLAMFGLGLFVFLFLLCRNLPQKFKNYDRVLVQSASFYAPRYNEASAGEKNDDGLIHEHDNHLSSNKGYTLIPSDSAV